jgi:hypothetical protein
MSLDFNKSVADPNLCHYSVGDESLILMTYSKSVVVGYKYSLTSEFKMKNLSMMHYFLGQEVWQRTDKIFPSQGKYTLKILKRFSMIECKIHCDGFKEED